MRAISNAGIISGKQQCFPDEGGKPSVSPCKPQFLRDVRHNSYSQTRLLDVNTTGVLYTMQGPCCILHVIGQGPHDLHPLTTAAINHFRAHKSRGSIIVTASIAGIYPLRPDPL